MIRCPSCRGPLEVEDRTAYCARCDLHLVDPTRLRRFAAYALSLPERISRILVGSAAGVVKGISELVVPEAIRSMKLYQVLLAKNLRYLIQEVGAVEGVYPAGAAPERGYIARKFVGNFVELAGIMTLRASPVWILAALSDVLGGTKVFVRELAAELRKQGLLDPSVQVDSVDQLLDGLQSFAGSVADRIDMPPLSVEELRQTLELLRREAGTLRLGRAVEPRSLEAIYSQMHAVAEREQRSVFEVSAAVALGAAEWIERSRRATLTGLEVGRALLDRSIFEYYGRALEELRREGYYRYLARTSRPYLRALLRHLAWRRITWTERYFLSRAGRRVRRLARGR